MANFLETLATGITGAALGAASEVGDKDYLSPFLEELRTNRRETQMKLGQRARLGALVARGDGIEDWVSESFPDMKPTEAYEQIANLDATSFNAMLSDLATYSASKENNELGFAAIWDQIADDPELAVQYQHILAGAEPSALEVVQASGRLEYKRTSDRKALEAYELWFTGAEAAVNPFLEEPLKAGNNELLQARLAQLATDVSDLAPEYQKMATENIAGWVADFSRTATAKEEGRMTTAIAAGNFTESLWDGGPTLVEMVANADNDTREQLYAAGLGNKVTELSKTYDTIAGLKAEGVDFTGASPELASIAALVSADGPSLQNRMTGGDISLLPGLAKVSEAELTEIVKGRQDEIKTETFIRSAGDMAGISMTEDDVATLPNGELVPTQAFQGRVLAEKVGEITQALRSVTLGTAKLKSLHNAGLLDAANLEWGITQLVDWRAALIMADSLPDVSTFTT
ncbi:MAG: hypothetical protein QF599_09620, partial [Planctomycetota bacterium]|nr:hypothetical protein [Planctomycetota bacterium]